LNLPLFLDTTLQVDRVIELSRSERRAKIDLLLSRFGFRLTSRYSKLEFKRVVIQNLGLVLDYLVKTDSFCASMVKASRLGRRPRRAQTLFAILAFVLEQATANQEVVADSSTDRQLTLKAKAYLRNAIRYIWARFDYSVDTVVDHMRCQRATEGPKKVGDLTFDVSIPESKCANRECRNADFFREHLPRIREICTELERMKNSGEELTPELKTILDALRLAETDPGRLINYKNCLAVGDVWIHLESKAANVRDFATRNYKESQVLCPILDLQMHQPEV
jgi:hypothetical protein